MVRYSGAFLLSEAATENRLEVNEAEILQRKNLYKQIYDEQTIDDFSIKEILLSQKYLQKIGICPYQDELKNAYSKFSSCKHDPSIDIAPIVQTEALLNCAASINVVDNINSERTLKMRDNYKAIGNMWLPFELYIDGDPKECVARIAAISQDITVDQFNNCLPLFPASKSLPIDSARAGVIRAMAVELQYAQKARSEGLLDQQKINEEITKRLNFILQQCNTTYRGREITDEKSLHKAYDKYYKQFFNKHEEVTLGILGSSDSVFLDSLYKKLIRKDTIAFKKDSIEWNLSNSKLLPPQLVNPVDTLNQGDFTKLIRTSYGFFIVKVVSVQIHESVPYESAKMKCIDLATRDLIADNDQERYKRAFDHYARNKKRYVSPDTFLLRIGLSPGLQLFKKCMQSNQNKIGNREAGFLGDTIKSIDLPEDIRLLFEKEINKKPRIDSLYGPVKSVYGYWHFYITHIHRGGKQIAFSNVKTPIMDEMAAVQDNSMKKAMSEETIKIAKEMAIAAIYEFNLMQAANNPSQDEIDHLLKEGDVDTAEITKDLSEQEKMDKARTCYFEKKLADLLDFKIKASKEVSIFPVVLRR